VASLTVHMLNNLRLSIAYRHAQGHPERMGSHDTEAAANRGVPTRDLRLLTIQAWHVMDKTHITCFGSYDLEQGPVSRNLGADILDYQLLALPSLGQIIWCLGDEVRQAWRELSSPK